MAITREARKALSSKQSKSVTTATRGKRVVLSMPKPSKKFIVQGSGKIVCSK